MPDRYPGGFPRPDTFGPSWGFGHGGLPAVVTPLDAENGVPVVSQLSQQIYLPQTFPIPDAKEFNVTGSIGTAAVQQQVTIPFTATGGVVNGILRIPGSTYGIIRSVVFDITNMLPTTSVDFSLIINGGAVQGYAQVQIFPRTAPFVQNGFDSGVFFQGPADISLQFDNNDGGNYVVGGSVGGWYWPQASDARWRQTGR